MFRLSNSTCGRRITTGSPHSMAVQSGWPVAQRAPAAAARRRRACVPCAAAAAFTETQSSQETDMNRWGKIMLSNGMVDYYEVLGVDDDADMKEIKQAYRALAKECHPDYLGNRGHNICILLNEAYETLMDEDARRRYNARLETALADEEDSYTGEPLSKWMPTVNPSMAKNTNPEEDRAVFVDEATCIGCKQCVWHACATFRMEGEHGRSRVFAQWLDTEEHIQAAVDSCPVDCIHWVKRADLPALEYVMQNRVARVNVGIMMSGQGRSGDVWSATEAFLKERRRKEEAQRMAQRQYSPQQEAARREAAEELLRTNFGFFARFFSSAIQSMESAVYGTGEDLKVGQRKRKAHWQERERAAAGGDYYLVPPERALVLAREQDVV